MYTLLHTASYNGQVDTMRWLLNHGADANSYSSGGFTPLNEAACEMQLEAVQVLFDHHADINSQDRTGRTSLYWILSHCGSKKKFVYMVQLLLKLGVNPNICTTENHRAPLHEASSQGLLEATRLLLSHEAKVDEKDKWGNTPFQLAASGGHEELTKLLVEHGAVPPSQ